MEAGFEYLDHLTDSDIAFRAWGASPEELFRAAWEAMLTVQISNPSGIIPRRREEVFVRAPGLDFLLYEFLEEQLYLRDAKRLYTVVESISIVPDDVGISLDAVAAGEAFDPARHEPGSDVKAITMYRLEVKEIPEGWEALVVLDV